MMETTLNFSKIDYPLYTTTKLEYFFYTEIVLQVYFGSIFLPLFYNNSELHSYYLFHDTSTNFITVVVGQIEVNTDKHWNQLMNSHLHTQ